MSTAVPTRSSAQYVAAGSAGVSALLLTMKAARTFGPDRFDTMEPLAGVFVALVAGVAFAAAYTVLRTPASSSRLLLAALVGSLIADLLPAAPPRYVELVPLAIAAGLMTGSPAARPPGHVGAGPHHPGWATALGWAGLVLHAAAGWLYLASGLVAPPYGVAILWLLWAVLLAGAIRLLRERPQWTPLVPVLAVALWFLVMFLGDILLNWQP